MSEFESHWAPHSFNLVPHQSKELYKLLLAEVQEALFAEWLSS